MQFLSIAWFFLAGALAFLALRQIRALPTWSAAWVLTVLFVAAGVPLVLFAYWGQYTAAGHRAYDEMDGLYPFAAGALGLLLTMAAALVGWLAARGRGSDG